MEIQVQELWKAPIYGIPTVNVGFRQFRRAEMLSIKIAIFSFKNILSKIEIFFKN